MAQRYRIAEQDGGETRIVVNQEAFDGGPPVGSSIPADAENRHWRQYLEWLDEGNEPDPMG